MIDEIKIRCFGCNQLVWLAVYDPELQVHFCSECCAKAGKEPPFTHSELLELTKDRKSVQ